MKRTINKNIGFISGSIEEGRFLFLIGNYLKKNYNIDFFVVFTRKFLYNFFLKKGYKNIYYLNWNHNAIDNRLVDYYLNKYSKFNLSLSIFSDPILKQQEEYYGIKIVIQHLIFWEEFTKKNNISVIIHYPTASVLGRTSYYFSKKYNIKHLIIQTGPVISETFTICDINENWIWREFIKLYSLKKSIINKNVKKKVDKVVQQIIKVKNNALKIRKVNLNIIMGLIYNTLNYKKFDLIEINEYKKFFNPFFRKYFMLFFKYDKIKKNEKFIFFPLHISWDAQIATRNPMLANQLYLVEILSRSLPYGYKLYVKEHPYNYAGEKISLLSKIKEYENVKLIHPEVNSLDLIKNSSAVVTINSTAGFETILLKKPLITFGRTFYSYFKYTKRVDYLNALPDLVEKVLFEDWNKIINTKRFLDEWYKFLFAVYKTSKKGAANSYKNYMGLGVNVIEKNIKDVSLSLWEAIK